MSKLRKGIIDKWMFLSKFTVSEWMGLNVSEWMGLDVFEWMCLTNFVETWHHEEDDTTARPNL